MIAFLSGSAGFLGLPPMDRGRRCREGSPIAPPAAVGRIGRACLLACLVAAVAAPAAVAAAATKRHSSTNWSGYAASGASFKGVQARWVQPAANCPWETTGWAISSFWVGLGGNSSASHRIEQIGTDTDCTGDGRAAYDAWYELWPADAVQVHLEVRAGDLLAASVRITGTGVVLQLRNLTTGRSFRRDIPVKAPDTSSAEWIAEAPAITLRHSTEILPLTDFGSVHFTQASATSTNGHTGTIADPAWGSGQIDFASEHGYGGDAAARFRDDVTAARGTASALHVGGSAFSVTWKKGRGTSKPLPSGAA